MTSYLKSLKEYIKQSKKDIIILNSFYVGTEPLKEGTMYLYNISLDSKELWLLIVDDEIVTLQITSDERQLKNMITSGIVRIWNQYEEVSYLLNLSDKENYQNTINGKILTRINLGEEDTYDDELKKKLSQYQDMIRSII